MARAFSPFSSAWYLTWYSRDVECNADWILSDRGGTEVRQHESGSQPKPQGFAVQSTEWWLKHPRFMFCFVNKDLHNLCFDAMNPLVTHEKNSEAFKVKLGNTFRENLIAEKYSPVMRCFDREELNRLRKQTHIWLQLKMTSFFGTLRSP